MYVHNKISENLNFVTLETKICDPLGEFKGLGVIGFMWMTPQTMMVVGLDMELSRMVSNYKSLRMSSQALGLE